MQLQEYQGANKAPWHPVCCASLRVYGFASCPTSAVLKSGLQVVLHILHENAHFCPDLYLNQS